MNAVHLHPADPLRLEHAAQAEQAAADYALAHTRAAAYRAAPYWPFAPLTSMQQAQRARQEEAMRAGRVL